MLTSISTHSTHTHIHIHTHRYTQMCYLNKRGPPTQSILGSAHSKVETEAAEETKYWSETKIVLMLAHILQSFYILAVVCFICVKKPYVVTLPHTEIFYLIRAIFRAANVYKLCLINFKCNMCTNI